MWREGQGEAPCGGCTHALADAFRMCPQQGTPGASAPVPSTPTPPTPHPHPRPPDRQSLERALSEDAESGGKPIPQIMYDVFNDRYNNPRVGIALQIIPIGCVFFCLVATTTYVSRCAPARRGAARGLACRAPLLSEGGALLGSAA
jgi:hypothetical protein